MTFFLFWSALGLLIYAFAGYPFILKGAAFFRRREASGGDGFLPAVSIVLSVYNEEAIIREKIENFLALDYPAGLLEMVVVCDQCADRTEAIIGEYLDRNVVLLVQERRQGKTLNLNRAVEVSRGEILVFTDANSMFDANAMRMLVRRFADPRLGLVSGRSVYVTPENRNVEVGGLYRDYEEMIKEAEGRAASIVGADGAIYALRRSLYRPLSAELINDFFHPIAAVLQGYRAVSEPEAVCRETVDDSYDNELSRQTRIMAQSWLIVISYMPVLAREGKAVYLWQLSSHKVLRWLTMPLMAVLLAATIANIDGYSGFRYALAVQVSFLLLAFFGVRLKKGFLRIPYMFTLLHLASLLGFVQFLRGARYTTWSPRND